jgi:hypothetical protein
MERTRVNRVAVFLGVLALALACGACGGSSTSPSNTSQTATQTGTVSSLNANSHTLTINRSGTMTLTLTWTGAADLDLYLTGSSCNVYPLPNNCQILVRSTATTGTRESITRTVSSGDTFKAWVDNFSVASVSYSLELDVR